MAPSFGRAAQAEEGAAGAATPIAVTFTLNDGETGVVFVAQSGATPGSVTTITNGGGWFQRGTVTNGIAKAEMWSTEAGAGVAASSLSVAWSGTDDGVQVEAAAYLGVLGIGPAVTASGATSNPSIAQTIQEGGNFSVAGFAFADGTLALPVPTALTGNFRTGDTNSVSGANDSAAALTDNTSATPGASVTNAVTEAASAGTKWAVIALELRSVGPSNPVPLLGNLFVGPIGFGR